MAQANTEGRHCEVAVRIRFDNKSEDLIAQDQAIKWDEKTCCLMTSTQSQRYYFDYVFGPTASQEQVYTSCCSSLIESFFKGYNCCIMTYGQTGAGKTFTMGSSSISSYHDESRGVLPRAFEEILATVERTKSEGTPVDLNVSFVEIYNEELRDLLDDGTNVSLSKMSSASKSIRVTEDPVSKAICVIGVTRIVISNVTDLLQCLNQGAASRVTASNSVNPTSSRSHAIFTLFMSKGSGNLLTTSKFHFVDLAGSERIKKTKAEGSRLKEGIHINTGLLALSNVINILSSETYRLQPSAHHVPYRDSKLTRILQDSLGGNSRTIMIACVNASPAHALESQSTIKYAARARNIQNIPIVNENPHVALVESYQRQIDDLNCQIMFLNDKQNSLLRDILHRDSLIRTLEKKKQYHERQHVSWRDACQRFCQLFHKCFTSDLQPIPTKDISEGSSELSTTQNLKIDANLDRNFLQDLSSHVTFLETSLESELYFRSPTSNLRNSVNTLTCSEELDIKSDVSPIKQELENQMKNQECLDQVDQLKPLSKPQRASCIIRNRMPAMSWDKKKEKNIGSDQGVSRKELMERYPVVECPWDSFQRYKRKKKEFSMDREAFVKKKNVTQEHDSKSPYSIFNEGTRYLTNRLLETYPRRTNYFNVGYLKRARCQGRKNLKPSDLAEQRRSHDSVCSFFKKSLDRVKKTIVSKIYLLSTTLDLKSEKEQDILCEQILQWSPTYKNGRLRVNNSVRCSLHRYGRQREMSPSISMDHTDTSCQLIEAEKPFRLTNISCYCAKLDGCIPLDQIFNDWISAQYFHNVKKKLHFLDKPKFINEEDQILMVSNQEMKVLFELLIYFSLNFLRLSTSTVAPTVDPSRSRSIPSYDRCVTQFASDKVKNRICVPPSFTKFSNRKSCSASNLRSRHRYRLTLIPITVFVSMSLKSSSRSLKCLAFYLKKPQSSIRSSQRFSYRSSFNYLLPDQSCLVSSSDSAMSSMHPPFNLSTTTLTTQHTKDSSNYPFSLNLLQNISPTTESFKSSKYPIGKIKTLPNTLPKRTKKGHKEPYIIHRKEKKSKRLFSHVKKDGFFSTLRSSFCANKGSVTVDGVRFIRNYGSDDNADASQPCQTIFSPLSSQS